MYDNNLLEAGLIPEIPDKITDKDIVRCKDYYEIPTEGLVKFGSWIVNSAGDIVNASHDYSVFTDQVMTNSRHNDLICWLCHLRGKLWFDAASEHDFISAFIYAILAKHSKSCELQDE